MSKQTLYLALSAALFTGLFSCQNSNNANPAANTATNPSSNNTPAPTPAPPTPAEIKLTYMEATAQKMCSCEGTLAMFAALKMGEEVKAGTKIPTPKEAKEIVQQLKLATKAMQTCIIPIEEEMIIKYPEAKAEQGLDLAMVKVCGDKMPKAMIAGIQKRAADKQNPTDEKALKQKQDKMNNK